MQTRLAKPAAPTSEPAPRRLWLDRSALLRREPAERTLTYLRWVIIAGATLYLIFSENVQDWLLGAGALVIGVLLNGVFTYLVEQRSFTPVWSVAAQAIDILLFQMYTAALHGGVGRYAPLYTSLVVVAAVRFGVVGAICSGLIGLLIHIVAAGGVDYSPPTAAITFAAILADAAALGYFAHLARQQQLANDRARAGLKNQIYEITVLHEVSNIVHDLKSEDALQNIVEITTQVMGFQRAALFLTNHVGEMLAQEYYSRSPEAQRARLPNLFIAPELYDSLLAEKDPVVIDGSQGSPDMRRGPILQVAVPLHGHESPIGVLIADRNDRGAVAQTDKEMLSNLAKSAVMAIENASLHRQVKRMANHDGVTDLFNHRYFQEALRAAIDESQGAWPISLLMIEIDKFKRYNDTFGHRQGDMALISLARALEEATQPWDGLVARYGGDEFVAILSHIDQHEGLAIARQIKEQACLLAEEKLRVHDLPTIMLSIGVATYPGDALTAADLIEASDQAMYVVKHSGGNQVHAYSQDFLQRRIN